MTLDEAIKHCEEVAEKNEKECKNWAYGASQDETFVQALGNAIYQGFDIRGE